MRRSSDIDTTTLAEDRELRADSLIADGAVLGNGLVLHDLGDGGLVIHELEGGRARLVGKFENAGDALAALDELELAA